MIDGGEVKDSNVSIRPKWSRNGYKEEVDGRTDAQRETDSESREAAKLNQESPTPNTRTHTHTLPCKWDFANASYFST